MISPEEKRAIEIGFNSIESYIDKMLCCLNLIKENNSYITKILEALYSTSEIESILSSFLSLEDNYVHLKKFYSTPRDYDDNTTTHYISFLKAEVANLATHSYPFIDPYIIDQVNESIKQQRVIDYSNDTTFIMKHMRFIIDNSSLCYSILNNISATLAIFEKIKNIDKSIVLIGANGSGKSSLARQLNNKHNQNIVFLSAQHFLYYSPKNSISFVGDEISSVQAFQRNTKNLSDESIINSLAKEMDSLITALLSQHTSCAIKSYDNPEEEKQQSILNKAISMWEKIIKHRHMYFEAPGLKIKGENIEPYQFNLLSDGEKAVFYYIGHVLLTNENAYIIVDEPENHLHLSVCKKLWDILEQERQDCKFIYLTHNLAFATSRSNRTVIWNKKYTHPYTWEYEILSPNDIIPEILVMEIVGTRDTIIFCEGAIGGVDYRLYSALFPNYTVIPVGGHHEVISYVNACNQSAYTEKKAIGIIDGDYHLPEQKEKWNKQGIFLLPINEIENILCDDFILRESIVLFGSESETLEDYYEAFWKLVDEEKEHMATTYAKETLNNFLLNNFFKESKNINLLINEVSTFTNPEKIKDNYDNFIGKITDYIAIKDYSSAIRIVNLKHRLTKDICNKIVNNYENRIINLIRTNDKIKKHIIDTYFIDFPLS